MAKIMLFRPTVQSSTPVSSDFNAFLYVGKHVVLKNWGKILCHFYVVFGHKSCRLKKYFIVTLAIVKAEVIEADRDPCQVTPTDPRHNLGRQKTKCRYTKYLDITCLLINLKAV